MIDLTVISVLPFRRGPESGGRLPTHATPEGRCGTDGTMHELGRGGLRRGRHRKGLRGMRVFVVAVALSVTLSAAPMYGQAPSPAPQAQLAQAATQKPAPPQTQKPATPAPAPPAAAQPTAPTPKFQDGLKYAYVRIDQVAAFSNQGK